MSQYSLPVQFYYNGRKHMRHMGPFEHSTEREFALTVNRKAIDDCSDLETLKPVAKNLLTGWSSLQTAVQSLMLENIQLRQAMAKQQVDLEAAEELIQGASILIDDLRDGRQSKKSRRSLWPFG
jgi:geranylgeranyl pyrophosphate synthase